MIKREYVEATNMNRGKYDWTYERQKFRNSLVKINPQVQPVKNDVAIALFIEKIS